MHSTQAMLAGYYGASKGAPPASTATQSAHATLPPKQTAPNQPPQAPSQKSAMSPVPPIDSPAFTPDVHIPQILKTYPMEKLLTEHRNMARDIKNLDSDMQQLVYENYNKFISATVSDRLSLINSMREFDL